MCIYLHKPTIVFIFAYKLKNMETMNEQKNAGGQAQETAQTKFDLILEELRLQERKEWEFLRRCEEFLGVESIEYKNTVIRWSQWHNAYNLVNDIINNQ